MAVADVLCIVALIILRGYKSPSHLWFILNFLTLLAVNRIRNSIDEATFLIKAVNVDISISRDPNV